MFKPENPSAFPQTELGPDGEVFCQHRGMTLADWFAGQALAGVMPVCVGDTPRAGEAMPQAFARKAFEIADAMLAERARRGIS